MISCDDRSRGSVFIARAPDIQVESKGFRLGVFRDSLPQGGDLRCRKPIRSICVNVLPALSVRAGRGTQPRPVSKCQFPTASPQSPVRPLEDTNLHRRPALPRPHRALRRRRSDEPPHLRDLCRDPARADPRKGRCRHHGQLVSPQKPAEDADKFFALLDVFFSIEASPSTIALISTSAILEFIFMTRTLSRSSSTSLIVGERSFKAMRPLALQASISGALFVKWGNHKGAASVQCNELIFARTGTHTDLFR